MGRPQNPERTQARRAEVAAATLRAIARHGIEGASLRSIAHEGGFTTGTLVYYFRNKQDILLFAGRMVLDGVVARVREAVSAHPSLSTLEQALLAELPSDDKKRLGWTIWLAFTAQAPSSELFRKEHAQRYAELRSLVRMCLENAHKAGMLEPSVELAAEAKRVLGLFDGLGLHALLEPDIYQESEQAQLFQHAMRSLQRA